MILSIIQGFQIDPDVAITGDIRPTARRAPSAAWQPRSAEQLPVSVRFVALPQEKFDQLVDAVICNGQQTVTDVQIIGIANLNDAIATVRMDRDPKLTDRRLPCSLPFRMRPRAI